MTFPIKGIFQLTGKLLRQGVVPLALVTVLLYYLPQQALHYGLLSLGRTELGALIVSAPMFSGSVLLAINQLLSAFHVAAVSEIALRAAAGKPLRARRLLINALVNAIPVLAIQLALQITILVGVAFLVVPGVFLGVALSVVVPAYVCEGKGVIEAFRRSFQLTDGRRWPIFAIWLAIKLACLVVIPNAFLSQVFTLFRLVHWLAPTLSLPDLPQGLQYGPFVGSLIGFGQILITMALVVLNTAIYLTLRFHKPDPGAKTIAEIFA